MKRAAGMIKPIVILIIILTIKSERCLERYTVTSNATLNFELHNSAGRIYYGLQAWIMLLLG